MHSVPVSERSGAEIEFVEMDEFYLKQIEFKNEILSVSKKLNFYPESARKLLEDWINSISIDWPISRRRFYATPIPLWFSDFNGAKIYAIGDKGKYYEPWKEKPKESFEVYKKGKKIGLVKDFKVEWIGETRVLDTWMDSSISELVLLDYARDDSFFKRAYPCSLRPQGKEIIRTWLYYTLLRGYLETKKPSFENVWINQHIVDEKGFKMSKSKGNGIDPHELIRDYGAEAIRFWAATEGDLSKQDLKCSKERIKAEMKTLTKLLNVSKFVMAFDKPTKQPILSPLDKIFMDYIENLTNFCSSHYDEYDFYNPAIQLRKFLWDDFSSHYVEIVKARAYNEMGEFSEEESNSAKYTLHFLLERILVLMYPIIPQITSLIADAKGIDLLNLEWPKGKNIDFSIDKVRKILDFNSEVWKTKKDNGISLRNEISGIKIPKELKPFEKDLIKTHNII